MEDYRSRRKAQARQTEQAILQAAMDLSRKQSFDKVSIREICQQAGITTGPFTITSAPRRICSPGALPLWTAIWSSPWPVMRMSLPPCGCAGFW